MGVRILKQLLTCFIKCSTIYSWFSVQSPPHCLFNYLHSLSSSDSPVDPSCNQSPSLLLHSSFTVTPVRFSFKPFSPCLISRLRTCLSRTHSPRLCQRNPTCLPPLDFASVRTLSAFCLPGSSEGAV